MEIKRPTIVAHLPPFDTVDKTYREGVVYDPHEAEVAKRVVLGKKSYDRVYMYGWYTYNDIKALLRLMEKPHGKKEEVE